MFPAEEGKKRRIDAESNVCDSNVARKSSRASVSDKILRAHHLFEARRREREKERDRIKFIILED